MLARGSNNFENGFTQICQTPSLPSHFAKQQSAPYKLGKVSSNVPSF
jgi:hypothetical protein